MTNPRLPVGRLMLDALRAPFDLEAASWRALVKSVSVVIVAILLSVAANHLQLVGTGGWLMALPVWAAVAMLAMEYQRQLLLGAQACAAAPSLWRQYGFYLLALGAMLSILAVVLGFLAYLVFPGMTFFVMAINSPEPWLASGTVILWTCVVLGAGYPVCRLSLLLPAAAVSHGVSPVRIWRLSRGNGFRLISLVVLVPGVINAMIFLVEPVQPGGPLTTALLGLADTYLAFFVLSLVALSYRYLSDQALPTRERPTGDTGRGRIRLPSGPVALVLLLGAGVAALWDAVYRVGPDENAFISRFGQHERLESDSGARVKMPFVERARVIPKTASFTAEGEGVFLTIHKKTLPLRYSFHWQIINEDVFARTSNGQTRFASRWVGDIAHSELRNEMARLGDDDLERLQQAGTVQFRAEEGAGVIGSLDGMLASVNDRVAELGVAVNAWEIEVR